MSSGSTTGAPPLLHAVTDSDQFSTKDPFLAAYLFKQKVPLGRIVDEGRQKRVFFQLTKEAGAQYRLEYAQSDAAAFVACHTHIMDLIKER